MKTGLLGSESITVPWPAGTPTQWDMSDPAIASIVAAADGLSDNVVGRAGGVVTVTIQATGFYPIQVDVTIADLSVAQPPFTVQTVV